MEDSIIVELYLQKNENAIKETDSKYGAYCFTIADNILHNKEDSEEWVNDPESVTGLNTEALNALFPVDMMDSCEEMMIQDWHGALYKKDDTAYLCFTYDPEVTYVLEYTPSKMSDADIIKMAESVEPIEEE